MAINMRNDCTGAEFKMEIQVGRNGHSPYVDPTTKNWFIFDDITRKYVDSHVRAEGKSAYEAAVEKGYEGTEVASNFKLSMKQIYPIMAFIKDDQVE